MVDQSQLTRFLNLKYRIVVEPIPEEEGGGFEAHVPTLGRGSCVGVGDTVEEAVRSVNECKHSLFILWLEKGYPIPEPDNESSVTDEYNGRILFRTSKEMHEHLVRTAEKQDVSLNAYLNQVISRGQSLALFEEKLNKVARQLEDRIDKRTERFVFANQQIERLAKEWHANARQAVHVPDTGEVSFTVKGRDNIIKMRESTQIEPAAA